MSASSFRCLCLIPARIIIENPSIIPDAEGVFYVLIDGGLHLLDATGYFSRQPLKHERSVHLFTGASLSLRLGIRRQLSGRAARSSLRRTLLAVEAACGGISATRNFGEPVTDAVGLNAWLATNAQFAFVPCKDSERHLKKLLSWVVSPLNLKQQITPEYARQLREWRREFGLTNNVIPLNGVIESGELVQ
jgi:hypothetical protein